MWITESPSRRPARERHSIYSENGERTRKYHQKSKNGCVYCKRRRIKCDELKPSCSNCTQRRRICEYQPDIKVLSPSRCPRTYLPSPTNGTQLLSTLNQGQILQALTPKDGIDPDLVDFEPAIRIFALETLNHFVCYDRLWLKTRKVQTIMQTHAISLVINHSHLLHAVLALSAAHLAKIKPDSGPYWMSSMVHWQHSLRAYAACFQRGLETQDIDAIYFSSQLQSMLAFIYAQKPFQPGVQRPAWLTSMQGTAILLHIPDIVSRLRQGIWQSRVKAHDQWDQRVQQNSENTQCKASRAMAALTQYCTEVHGTDASSIEERLAFLKILESFPPRPDSINAFTSFVSHAPAAFIAGVKSGDRTPLLLLIYWCKLFSKTGQWWLVDSAQSEIRRLVALVLQDADGRTMDLLNILLKDEIPPEQPA